MESPLRKARKARKMRLKDLQEQLSQRGINRTISYLSQLENGLFWPSGDVVAALVELFDGSLTEMQILYPKRNEEESSAA